MPTFFWNCVAKCWRLLLALRYKIEVKGLDELDAAAHKQGILFLPNHPAHMDPLFLFLFLWPKFRMRPVVIEYVYRLPLLKPFMKLVRAISIPNFETSINQLKVKKANDALQEIGEGLKKGENFIVYPAGKLKNSGREVIGAASGAHGLVQGCPEARIVLIRTTGLWGSSFSRALLGKSPHLPEVIGHGIKTLLKNAIFFTPRRKVTIEIAPNQTDIPRDAARLDFNRYLENWYNRYPDAHGKIVDTEPLLLVSYSRWKKEIPKVYQPKKKREGHEIEISDELSAKVYAEIRRIVNNPGIEIKPEMNLATDLGLDSLNTAELIVFISKNYDVQELHPEDIETVQTVLEVAEGSRSSGRSREAGVFHWPKETGRPDPEAPVGKIFPEVFLKSCERMKNFAACGDDLVGILSYKTMKRAAIVLSLHFQKLPGEHVAVLLPASAGVYLVILALQFAGKIPVMLNWTLGPRYLEEMVNEAKAEIVISSWRFLDRLSNVDFGSLIDKIELLEDIREQIPLGAKLKGSMISLRSVRGVLRALELERIDENRAAVILYTSGTEAKPKGVPLSHKNIISNQRSALQCLKVTEQDVLYGILPPFHSFGFSVVGLFPLFIGMKVAFYPDPTDGFALAEGIERWKITLFCSPPSFLKGLLNSAKVEQLKTVRWFISGAEKAPPELYERVEKLGTAARLIEGYGITECAPVLTLTRPNLPAIGVGQPLPDVEVCTIHLETQELLAKGEEGEICVRGPNVFNGYLGNPRDPFIELEGRRWYRTGDIGKLDADGNLLISGRIKRFTKVGGEMISLGGVEEVLVKAFIGQGKISADVPSLAVIADERREGQPQLVLFTTASISREEANQILISQGFSRLVKISSVKKVDEIPLMGTGKTDYRSLQKQLNNNNKANGNAA
jgi:acyl carrier protein